MLSTLDDSADVVRQLTEVARTVVPRDPVRVRAHRDGPLGFDRALWQRFAELGWLGLLVPEPHPGRGRWRSCLPLRQWRGRSARPVGWSRSWRPVSSSRPAWPRYRPHRTCADCCSPRWQARSSRPRGPPRAGDGQQAVRCRRPSTTTGSPCPARRTGCPSVPPTCSLSWPTTGTSRCWCASTRQHPACARPHSR